MGFWDHPVSVNNWKYPTKILDVKPRSKASNPCDSCLYIEYCQPEFKFKGFFSIFLDGVVSKTFQVSY